MPWKIITADFETERPHLHMRDPGEPIHLLSFFKESLVEVRVGHVEPALCPVIAEVTPDAVVVRAYRFKREHTKIVASILASLDCSEDEVRDAMDWMYKQMGAMPVDGQGYYHGNLDGEPRRTGWPYDLTNDALIESVNDTGQIPKVRWDALAAEVGRRRLNHLMARRTSPGKDFEVWRRPKRGLTPLQPSVDSDT